MDFKKLAPWVAVFGIVGISIWSLLMERFSARALAPQISRQVPVDQPFMGEDEGVF